MRVILALVSALAPCLDMGRQMVLPIRFRSLVRSISTRQMASLSHQGQALGSIILN